MGGRTRKAVLVAACGLMLFAPGAGARARVIGTGAAGGASDGTASSPDVAVRPGGRGYLGAWIAATGTDASPNYEVQVRPLHPDGRPAGEPRTISAFGGRGSAFGLVALSVAAGAGDRFVITYTGYAESGEDRYLGAVYARSVDGRGRPLGPTHRLTAVREGEYVPASSVAFDPVTRRFLVAWHTVARRSAIEARLLSAGGAPRDGRMRLSRTPGVGSPALAARGASGSFLAVWEEDDHLSGRVVGAAGRPVGGDFVLPAGPIPSELSDGSAFDPALAYDAHRGQFAVVWQEETGVDSAVLMQRLSRDGRRPRGRTLVVSEVGGRDETHDGPDVAFGAADRTFTVTWEHFMMSTSAPICSEQELLLRRVRSNGRPAGRARALSRPNDPAGPPQLNGGGECFPSPDDPAVVARSGAPGYVALWSRAPFVLGIAR